MDLPKIALGDIDARIKIEKGLGTVEALQARSEDLELLGSGTVKLGQRLDVSQPDMDFKLKTEPEFVKRLGLIGAGLSILPAGQERPEVPRGAPGRLLQPSQLRPRAPAADDALVPCPG